LASYKPNNVFKVTGSPVHDFVLLNLFTSSCKAFEFLRQFVLLFFAVTVSLSLALAWQMVVEPTCRRKALPPELLLCRGSPWLFWAC
jgi:hypothetical protein